MLNSPSKQIPPGIKREAYLEAIRGIYRRSLFVTAQDLLGFEDITTFTHGPIIRALEGPQPRKIICVPRGTFKSSITSIAYPIWLLINNPNLRIMIDSELYTNSTLYLREIKNRMLSEKFVTVFGDWRTTIWNESEILIKPRTKNVKEPSIMVAAIGTTKVGVHVDTIIADDYNSPNNSSTPEQRKKVIDHYKYNQSILEPDGTYVVVGTRYAEEDMIGWLLKNELGLKTLDHLKQFQKKDGVYYA